METLILTIALNIIPNIVATVLVAGCLALIFFFVPKYIVDYEWRNEQSANENDKSASFELKVTRMEHIGRAQRAFASTHHTKDDVASLLQQYAEKTRSYYEILLREDKWTDIEATTNAQVNYNNVLMLLISYALTTGDDSIEIHSVMGNIMLIVFSFTSTIFFCIIIGAMAQFYSNLLRMLIGLILGMDKADRNPNKMCYKYMWDLVKREAILLVINFILAASGIVAGTALMKRDQTDWSWSMALIYAQSAAFTSGHTHYTPDPIEGNSTTVMYALFIMTLHIWMITWLAMFFASGISLARCIYSTQWAELSEEEFYALQEKIENRKRQRQLDNPKYEE